MNDHNTVLRSGRLAFGALIQPHRKPNTENATEYIAYKLAAVLAKEKSGNDYSVQTAIASLTEAQRDLDRDDPGYLMVEATLIALKLVNMRDCSDRDVRREARDLLQTLGRAIETNASIRSLTALRSGAAREYLGLRKAA